jgi:poly-beta-1,6-N-acetyl-D-glucosamine biosynthesis protein PgaD
MNWPPLIEGANVPGWVRLRDWVLTLLAWALLGYLMRETLDLLHDYLRYPIFEFTSATPPDWRELWGRLRPFSYFIAVLTVWLLFWALLRGRRLRATAPVPQPAPLTLAAHAAAFGLDEAALARWTEARVLVVHFDATGQVSHAEAKRSD